MQNRDFDFSKLDTYQSNDKDFDFSHLNTYENNKLENKKVTNNDNDNVKKLIVGTNPLEQIKSFLLGMGKGGENVATTLTGGYAPSTMQDVEKMTGGSKSPLAEFAGQYAPILATAPQGVLSQMITGGTYGAMQSPESPLKGAIEGSLPIPAIKGLSKLNPLKLTAKNIMKDVVSKGEKAAEEFRNEYFC